MSKKKHNHRSTKSASLDGPRTTAPQLPLSKGGRRRQHAALAAAQANVHLSDNANTYHDPFVWREALSYTDPIASREAILAYFDERQSALSVDEVAEHFTLHQRLDILLRRLDAMVRDGQLTRTKKGKYAPRDAKDLCVGVVIGHPDGFGFLRLEATEGEDIFLPATEMRKVIHGDRVQAVRGKVDRRGRYEGCIVRVLSRACQRFVGFIRVRNGMYYVEPDDKRIHHLVEILPDKALEVQEGQCVVCTMVAQPTAHSAPIAKVDAVLGQRLSASIIVEMAIHAHGLPDRFTEDVAQEVLHIPQEVTAQMTRDRTDLRHLPFVTIDGETAKDFDDAVYCHDTEYGFRLFVAIADVAHYVQANSEIDLQAQVRATSVYFPGYVVPMLPAALSNGICSLNPQVDRLCLVCQIDFDTQGHVRNSVFYEAVICSHARLTYTEVSEAITETHAEQNSSPERLLGALQQPIMRLYRLYQCLAQVREQRGAIAFESAQMHFILNAAGEVEQAVSQPRTEAHKLIEECMIAANVEAARYITSAKIHAPLRVHAPPQESKYEDLCQFLKEFRLSLPPLQKVCSIDFSRLLQEVRALPESALIESVLLRSQSLAVYATQNVGHFGLALEMYTHFTSPIRRYPDLLVHRAIKHLIHQRSPESFIYTYADMERLVAHCSSRERKADDAEREVNDRYRAAWIGRRIGQTFEGVVSGVTSFGLFIELHPSCVTGLVHISDLQGDYYLFDAVRKTLSGSRHGRVYRLGDPVRVIVHRASIQDRKIDFRLVE